MTTLKLLKLIGPTLLIGAVTGCAASSRESQSRDSQSGPAALAGETAQASPAPPAAAAPVVVAVDNFQFTPEVVTVKVGQQVTWVNHDDVPHTVTATKKSFGSGALDTDDKFSHVFKAAGEFDYFCAVHPHMTGRVIVK